MLVAFLDLDGGGLLSLLDLMDALVEEVAQLSLEVLMLLATLLILGLLRSLGLVGSEATDRSPIRSVMTGYTDDWTCRPAPIVVRSLMSDRA